MLEPDGVDSVRVHNQRVPTASRNQDFGRLSRFPIGLQRAAQLRDVYLKRSPPSSGLIVAPNLLEDPIRRKDLVGVDQQQPQQCPRLPGVQRDWLPISNGFEGAENAKVQLRVSQEAKATNSRRFGPSNVVTRWSRQGGNEWHPEATRGHDCLPETVAPPRLRTLAGTNGHDVARTFNPKCVGSSPTGPTRYADGLDRFT